MTTLSRRSTDCRTASHDADVKRIVVSAVVVAGMGLVLNMCAMAAAGMPVPDPIDRLANILIGALIGLIGKAGLDKLMEGAIPVINPPGEPLKTEEVKSDE